MMLFELFGKMSVYFFPSHVTILIELNKSGANCLGSVAGPVIQVSGRTGFEDGSRTAAPVEVKNDLHSVCIKAEVNMAGPLGLTLTLGTV